MSRTSNEQSWTHFEHWMEDVNAAQWLTINNHILESDLTNKTVLDFGCNRGVSLRALYSQKPFHHGYGVDVEEEAIKAAKANQGDLPVSYQAGDHIRHLEGMIDIAFSHEVVYLLKDLEQHAKEMSAALKEGGVYYLALAAHPENPVWEGAKPYMIDKYGLEPQDHTPYDIADVFSAQGFSIQARRFAFDGFLTINPDRKDCMPSLVELLKAYSDYKILFRLVKK